MGNKQPAIEACRTPEPAPGQQGFSRFTESFARIPDSTSNASLQEQLRARLEPSGDRYRSKRLRAHLYGGCEATAEQRAELDGHRAGWSEDDRDLVGDPYAGQWPEEWECEVLKDYIRDHHGLFANQPSWTVDGKPVINDDYQHYLRESGVPREFDTKRKRYTEMRAPYQWANAPDAECAEQVADCVYERTEGIMSHSDAEVLECVEHVSKRDLGEADRHLQDKHPEGKESLRERVLDDITPFTEGRTRAIDTLDAGETFTGLQICASLGIGPLQGARCWGMTSDLEPFGSTGVSASPGDFSPEISGGIGLVRAGRDCYQGSGGELGGGLSTPGVNLGVNGSALLTPTGSYCGSTVGLEVGGGDVTPWDVKLGGGVGAGSGQFRSMGNR